MLNMNGVRSSYTSEFVYGNIATQSVPSREQIEIQRKHKRHTVEQEEIKGLAMSAPLVVFFAIVTMVCLVMSVSYLHMQSNITATRDSISQLKSQISTVQSQNNALNYSINSYVNVDHVYKVATTKLGMKQATDKQISTYKASDSGYTLQYGDIPRK